MRFASFLVTSAVVFTGLVAACSDPIEKEDGGDDDDNPSKPDSSTTRADSGKKPDASKPDSGKPDSGDSGTIIVTGDACEGELETYNACDLDQMTCGPDDYVEWCHANETATDSAQRIAARAQCLGTAYCDTDVRADCIYQQYNQVQQSAAQNALLEHFCAACEPADPAACKARTLHYNGDPASTDTIFLASWELAAPIVDALDANCIDAALHGDAGATCATRFDNCAGDYYVGALVDCPAK
jgi:hypothetical protein